MNFFNNNHFLLTIVSIIYFSIRTQVKSEDSSATSINNSKSISNNLEEGVVKNFELHDSIECGKTDKLMEICFDKLPQEFKEFLHVTKIPINEKDILSKCTVFRQGINCFEQYSAKCLDRERIKLLQNNVSGAKNFLTKLCEDKHFQSDYLKHKDCLMYIQEDWNKCSSSFQSILTEELHTSRNVSGRFMQFCWYAYENCVFNSAKYKCNKNSAKVVRLIAKMLSDDRHFRHCHQYENMICSTGRSSRILRPMFLAELAIAALTVISIM